MENLLTIIEDFKTTTLGPGWYDPGNDAGSWSFFKSTFLLNPDVTSSNPNGVITACKTFINADHGNPDRGMWGTMGNKMSSLLSIWTGDLANSYPNDFSMCFMDCFVIPDRAAHNSDLWQHVANCGRSIHDSYVDKFVGLTAFRQNVLSNGWYDPTEDTDSWHFFKKTFVINPYINENNIPALKVACNTFINADHGNPDRGMWDTMGNKMTDFITSWNDHLNPPTDMNEFIVSFLECFQITNHAAHNADLWTHVAIASEDIQQDYMSFVSDIVLFRYSCLGPGWYDPTEDTDSWAYFKSTFLLDYNIRESDPTAIINACTAFANADHGAPDRGMWDTMGARMKLFVDKWSNPPSPDLLNQFKIDFLLCFVIPQRPAHNADLWSQVLSSAWRIACWLYDDDIIEEFKFYTLGPGWYDPTEDTDSWAFFKSNFLTNAAVDADNLQGIIDACNTFIAADHGAPDRGMWDTMGGKMTNFVAKWTLPISPADTDEFLLEFVECMVIPSDHAAHNADLWRHVAGMAHSADQKEEFAKAAIAPPFPPKSSGMLMDRIAYDIGEWTGSQIGIIAFEPKPGMLPQYYTSLFGYELFHAQHVVRLNNKDNFAYFAVTNSRENSGFLTIMKTNGGVLKENDDLIYPVGEHAGSFVWQEVYNGGNSPGNWNHPCKMAVLDGVLIVAAQNWQSHSPGTTEDSLLWYDITDPENPVFMAQWTKSQMGIPDGEISTVDLVKTMDDKFLINAGGDGHYVIFKADLVSTNIADWTQVSGATFSGQHGACCRSNQQIALNGGSDYYFDASRSDENFTFVRFDNNGVNGETTNYPNSLPGASRDWDTASIYVSENRVPIIYTVKSGSEWDSYRIYQAHL